VATGVASCPPRRSLFLFQQMQCAGADGREADAVNVIVERRKKRR
jgi:hypothetical protein